MGSFFKLLDYGVGLYMWIVIFSVVISWLLLFEILNPKNDKVKSIMGFLERLTEPPLNYIRRFVPTFSGLDISPVILLIILVIVQNIVRSLV